MKPPDEIKKGLVYCVEPYCPGEKCPYYHAESCAQDKTYDAIAYIQQLEAERDAALECIEKLMVILKRYPYAATNGCAYQAYMEISKYVETMRGVQKED